MTTLADQKPLCNERQDDQSSLGVQQVKDPALEQQLAAVAHV